MNSKMLLEVAEYLKTQASVLQITERLGLKDSVRSVEAAPFGLDALGRPKPCPSFDGLKPLWEAAQRDGKFNMFAFIGQGMQQGAAQMYSEHVTDWVAVDKALMELAATEWAKDWLSHDVNAELIHSDYLKRFLGYTVKRKYDALGNFTYEHVG